MFYVEWRIRYMSYATDPSSNPVDIPGALPYDWFNWLNAQQRVTSKSHGQQFDQWCAIRKQWAESSEELTAKDLWTSNFRNKHWIEPALSWAVSRWRSGRSRHLPESAGRTPSAGKVQSCRPFRVRRRRGVSFGFSTISACHQRSESCYMKCVNKDLSNRLCFHRVHTVYTMTLKVAFIIGIQNSSTNTLSSKLAISNLSVRDACQ